MAPILLVLWKTSKNFSNEWNLQKGRKYFQKSTVNYKRIMLNSYKVNQIK